MIRLGWWLLGLAAVGYGICGWAWSIAGQEWAGWPALACAVLVGVVGLFVVVPVADAHRGSFQGTVFRAPTMLGSRSVDLRRAQVWVLRVPVSATSPTQTWLVRDGRRLLVVENPEWHRDGCALTLAQELEQRMGPQARLHRSGGLALGMLWLAGALVLVAVLAVLFAWGLPALLGLLVHH